MDDKNARTMGMLCHLASLSGYVIPFGNIIGPLVVWMLKKEESDFIDFHGKEAVNFQITMTLAAIVSAILIVVLIGILLLPAVIILNIVFVIIASIKANDGERYEYPFNIRFIK